MTLKGVGWRFPENGGGLAAGFNDSSIDHFKGHRLSSLVREVIQNSLDAKSESSKPVIVDFRIDKIDKSELPEVLTLKEHIERAKETAVIQNATEAVEFYEKALETLSNNSPLQFLSIHDSNTTGLTGPSNGPNGAWFALTKGAGLTQKPTNSLGSFGHGSKAPFVSSVLRTIFYLSQVHSNVEEEKLRFQGKSILQSHIGPNGEMTQGTGFYGQIKSCSPLVGTNIPRWALEKRSKVFQSSGTSIFIPATTWSENSLPAISLTAIANFFYAIYKGVLEVNIEGLETLSNKNIVEKYRHYSQILSEPFGEIDRESIADSLESIETIVNPTHSHEQQINGFGRIEWYLRMGETIDGREVAVARGNGMLVTKKAPNLKIFRNFKPFDMFVCVSPGAGSDLLKSIENPEHNNFEFDRIDDLAKRRKAQKTYENFSKEIREIVKRYASFLTTDQVQVDDLRDLFGDITNDGENPNSGSERGQKIQIANGAFIFKPKDSPEDRFIPGEGDPSEVPGKGHRSGKKKKKTSGGSIPSPDGPLTIFGPSKPDPATNKRKFLKLKNLRMRPVAGANNKTSIFFDSPLSGRVSVRLLRVGETDNEPLSVLIDNRLSTEFEVELHAGRREQIEIHLPDQVINFAIEGEVIVLEP